VNRRNVVLDLAAQVIFYPVLVGAVWLLFAGHNQPGGGFVGGLVVGTAITLRYLAGGIEEVRSLTGVKPWTILGTGLLISAVTAATSLVVGHEALESAVIDVDVAVIGHVATTTALFFDIGVFVLVVGLVLMMFEAFGDTSRDDAPHEDAQ
jgi:multicomponent Na+:H+ antiporter subunit A